MNKVILIGRLTKDPELRTTNSDLAVATFTVAVDRKFKSASGEKQADFIHVVAWRQKAEFVSKYFNKGSRIVIEGTLQSRRWEDADGKSRSVIEVVAEDIEFGESARGGGAFNKNEEETEAPEATFGGGDDTSLPFDL